MAEPCSERTGRKGVQVETENEQFAAMWPRSPQNLKSSHFTLLFGQVRRGSLEMYQNLLTHVQSLCFSHLIILFCDVPVAVALVASQNPYFCLITALVGFLRSTFLTCSRNTFIRSLSFNLGLDLFCGNCPTALFSLRSLFLGIGSGDGLASQ